MVTVENERPGDEPGLRLSPWFRQISSALWNGELLRQPSQTFRRHSDLRNGLLSPVAAHHDGDLVFQVSLVNAVLIGDILRRP